MIRALAIAIFVAFWAAVVVGIFLAPIPTISALASAIALSAALGYLAWDWMRTFPARAGRENRGEVGDD